MADKKVVRVDTGADEKNTGGDSDSSWRPTAEAKGSATRLRLGAAALWVLALAGEAYAIFGLLRDDPVNMVLLIGLIVVIGLLAIGGSLLWKKANRLDPASRSEPVRFFVQNQLGAIITVLAFLPLIAMIFLDKEMSGKEKALAGTVGAVVMVVATLIGVDWNAPSIEQYDEETRKVVAITGKNLVFWTTSGDVFHLCEDASAVNLESKDNTIFSGTVAEAHAAGKDRLTLQIEQEKRQCGLDTPAP